MEYIETVSRNTYDNGWFYANQYKKRKWRM